MGIMTLLCNRGDENIIKWGQSPAERKIAKETFERYKAAGFAMFEMDEDDNQGAKMTEFDPEVHGIVAIPRMVGG